MFSFSIFYLLKVNNFRMEKRKDLEKMMMKNLRMTMKAKQ